MVCGTINAFQSEVAVTEVPSCTCFKFRNRTIAPSAVPFSTVSEQASLAIRWENDRTEYEGVTVAETTSNRSLPTKFSSLLWSAITASDSSAGLAPSL